MCAHANILRLTYLQQYQKLDLKEKLGFEFETMGKLWPGEQWSSYGRNGMSLLATILHVFTADTLKL